MDPKELKKKKKVLFKNIDILRDSLALLVESGLFDYGEVFYNDLEALDEEMRASEDADELTELIERARAFEKQICALYERTGASSTDLDWPKFEGDVTTAPIE